jgi:hypothetical protein
MDKHYWLRCHHQGRRWIHAFSGYEDRRAIERGLKLAQSLAHPDIAGLSDYDLLQRRGWRHGVVELINELGVVLHEWQPDER